MKIDKRFYHFFNLRKVENQNMIGPDLQKALHDLRDRLRADNSEQIKKEISELEQQFAKQQSQRMIPGMADQDRGFKGAIGATLKDNAPRIRDFMSRKTAGDLVLEVKAAGDMGLDTNLTGGSVSVSSLLPGIVMNAPYKQHISPLLQTIPIGGDLVALRENGAGEGSIGAVAENAQKPQKDYDLQEVTYKANFIAGFARVSRKFMLTIPTATNFLTSRLLEDYMQAEDNLLLNGTGVDPEPLGINVAGNFTAATAPSTDNDYIQLILGVGQLAAMNRNADLIIMHPSDLFRLLTNQASGSGMFDSPAAVQATPEGSMKVAGATVITTVAQTPGRYTILDRSGFIIGVLDALNIRFFEQDSDNVQKNMVTVRVESNIAFAGLASTYAVMGTF
jgi:HK97 family phage major capsid protein